MQPTGLLTHRRSDDLDLLIQVINDKFDEVA